MKLNSILMEASFVLSDLPDRGAYLDAAQQTLVGLLPGDDVFWTEGNFARKTSMVWHGPDRALDTSLGEAMGQAADHPVMSSYFADLRNLNPRRISDVTTGVLWRHTAAHDLLHTAMGRHQLSIAISLSRQMEGSAWVVGRRTRDFTAADVNVAAAVQPLLAALDRMYLRRLPVSHLQTAQLEQARDRIGLSPREVDILTLIAAGLTAEAAARVRRISVGTVRKHLQNTYAKLGCSDRLVAVDEARRRGVLSPPERYRNQHDGKPDGPE